MFCFMLLRNSYGSDGKVLWIIGGKGFVAFSSHIESITFRLGLICSVRSLRNEDRVRYGASLWVKLGNQLLCFAILLLVLDIHMYVIHDRGKVLISVMSSNLDQLCIWGVNEVRCVARLGLLLNNKLLVM